MRSGMAKKVIVVSIVCSITAICVIAVATAGSQVSSRATEVLVSSSEAPDSSGAKVPLSPQQDARRLEVEKAIKERESRTAQSAAAFPPPSAARAAQEGKGAPGAPERNEFEVLASEFFGDPARGVSTGRLTPTFDENVPQEAKAGGEKDIIEREMKRLQGEMLKRMNTIASRLKLDQNQREAITQIAERTVQQIREIRQQFAGSQMTEYDKESMRSQIQAAHRSAGESIRNVLGDEKYKEFRKESTYYKNLDQRVYDVQKSMEAQGKQLDRIERSTKPRPDGSSE
jgi:hypothetical protein